MFSKADVHNPHTRIVPTCFLQPLFNDFDNASTPIVKNPEFRTVGASYLYSTTPLLTRPTLNNNTGAANSFTVDGLTSAHLVFAGLMNNSGSANDKDVAVRITRWYPIRLPLLNINGAKGVDGYIPIAQDYTVTLGNNNVGILSAVTQTDAPTGTSLNTDAYFADTITAVKSMGPPDEILYSPANDTIGILTLDVHGAAYVSVDIKTGSASPDKCQVFYGAE